MSVVKRKPETDSTIKNGNLPPSFYNE